MDTEDWLQRIRTFSFPEWKPRPRLLYSARDVPHLRERAARFPSWLEQVRREAESALALQSESSEQSAEPCYSLLAAAARMPTMDKR